MATGVGALGGTAHCYRFWLGFTDCRKAAEDPRLCVLERHDYMECLSRESLVRMAPLLLRGAAQRPRVVAGCAVLRDAAFMAALSRSYC